MSKNHKISAEVTAKTVNFEQGMKRVTTGLKSTGRELKQVGKQIRQSANQWGTYALAAAGAAAAAGTAIVKSSISSIRELKNQANAAGLTVAALQRGAFAAKEFGIEQDKYSDILKDVNDRVGDFLQTGGGPMADFFEEIGPKVDITAEAFKGLNSQEALGLFISSLEKANLNQQEMTFYMEAIASDSTRLIPLFEKNGQKMNEMADAAKDLGIGLSEIEVEQALEANKQFEQMANVLDGEVKRLVAEIAPLITEMMKSAIVAIREFKKEGTGSFDAMSQSANVLSKVVGVFANGLHGIQIIVKGLHVGFAGFATLLAKVFEGLSKFAKTIFDKAIYPIRELLKVASQLPGVMGGDIYAGALEGLNKLDAGFNKSIKGIEGFTNAQIENTTKIMDELKGMLMEPLPAEGIQKMFEDWVAAANAAKEQIKQTVTGGQETGETDPNRQGGKDGDPAQVSPVTQYQQETIGILEAMGLRFQLQEEATLAANQRELEMLNAQLDAKEISQREHEEKVTEIKRKNAELQRSITLQNIQDGFRILASGSKKVQKVMKGIAIGNAIIKGKESAVAAWSAGMATGGPFAPLVAAAYTAASLAKTNAMIQGIRSSGKGGGGGGGASLPMGGGAAMGGGGGGSAGPQAPTRIFNVELAGSSGTSVSQTRGLLELIGEQAGDNVEINIRGGD